MQQDNPIKNQATEEISAIPQTVIQVITNPAAFFRAMPRTGGFLRPLVFMVIMGTVGGFLQALLSLVGLSTGGLVSGVAAIILMPLLVTVFGFIGAAILFVIWKLMRSRHGFETAYRGMAYSAAITPITSILGLLPYLGGILGLVWMTYLLVVVSTQVHEIKAKTAWTGFGAIGAILILMTLSTEIAARKMARGLENWQKETGLNQKGLESLEDMSPEEAGRAVGKFLKGMSQESAE